MAGDFRPYIGRTVLVQLDEHTITGVLHAESGTVLTLRSAQLLAADGPTDMDGEVVVDRLRIQWVQVGNG